MIELYQFAPHWACPMPARFGRSWRPICAWQGCPTPRPLYAQTLQSAPKGKLPYIPRRRTHHCRQQPHHRLSQVHLWRRAGRWLTQPACPGSGGSACWREHLYWAVLYTRWIEPEGWAMTRPRFADLPAPLAGWCHRWRAAAWRASCTATAWGATAQQRSTPGLR